MIRAISTAAATTHRPTICQAHRARPAPNALPATHTTTTKEGKAMKGESNERERAAYIEFITRMLTDRADMRIVRIVYEMVLRLID